MKSNYEMRGSLAIKPVFEESAGELISLDWYRGDDRLEESEVDCVLDNFDGEPIAKTRSDRIFLAMASAVAVFALFFFSFAPIL